MAINTVNIKDWLKELNIKYSLGFEKFYTGKIDNKQLKVLGIYDLSKTNPYIIPIGGNTNKIYNEKYYSILVHYSNNYVETENKGYEIVKAIIAENETNLIINDIEISDIQVISNNEDVSTDDNGIYERVIQIKIIYNGGL